MNRQLLAVIVAIASIGGFSINAVADTQELGTCLVDSLDGKERKQLAKWIYFAIAAHPEMTSFSNVTADDRQATDEYVGELVTRLLVDDCPAAFKAAQSSDPLALQKSFEFVGQVAMQELITNQDVVVAISSYANYADQERINSLFAPE